MKELYITIKEGTGSHKVRIDEVCGSANKCARYLIAKYGSGFDAFVAKHQLEFEKNLKNLEGK